VPRLGCYYVVPLNIKSKLFETALDVEIANLKLEDGQDPQDEAVGELKMIVGMDTLG